VRRLNEIIALASTSGALPNLPLGIGFTVSHVAVVQVVIHLAHSLNGLGVGGTIYSFGSRVLNLKTDIASAE
jgi:hypothetical protein